MENKRIIALLIEDNPGDARLIQEMMSEVSDASFTLQHANRLSKGLEQLTKGNIDVVMLDLGLPDSSGFGTFATVQDHAPDVPIVMLTGLDDATLAVKAVHDGAQDYLIKKEMNGNLLVRSLYYAIERKKMADAHKKAEDQIKRSLKEKEVMLREIHHRVKNNLQVVSSLLNIQAQSARDKDIIDILSEFRERINAMSLIHSQLYESGNLSEICMKKFVDRLLGPLLQDLHVRNTKVTTIVNVEDHPFPISVAVPIGLIINELLSNIFKHAFNGREKGIIEVSLCVSENVRINLTVSDNGVGLPPGFDINTTKTLGMHLVKILAEDQLQGNLDVINTTGTTFRIEFEMESEDNTHIVEKN